MHLQTQADRIEFEMNEIQQSWIESSEKEDPEHPSHHKSLSDTAIKALHRIRSVGTLALHIGQLLLSGRMRDDSSQHGPGPCHEAPFRRFKEVTTKCVIYC
jgi:hypothetical protein